MTSLRALSELVATLCRGINRLCTVLAIAALILLLALIAVQVLGRYLLHAPPSWTEEAARFCMIWMGLLGATVAYHSKTDPVIVDMPLAPTRARRRAFIVARALAVTTFALPLALHGVAFVVRYQTRVSEALQLNLGWVVAAIPLCACILCLHAGNELLQEFTHTDPQPEEPP
jgi:TRAP-type transport system small permease protein